MDGSGEIYIGSVLLEKNRWTEHKQPSFRVSDWMERFREDGFDGVELWANHAADAAELELLRTSTRPISIFNSYAAFSGAERAEREQSARLTETLKSPRVKYNVGADREQRETYMENLRTLRNQLPAAVTLLCECHPGTLIEDAPDAQRFFDELGLKGHGIIVHPFSRRETLVEWFETFGPAIQHAHLQMRDENDRMTRFDRHPRQVRDALNIMKDYGFQGSFTLEFTEGTGQPDEDIETLYGNALRDFAYLNEMLGN